MAKGGGGEHSHIKRMEGVVIPFRLKDAVLVALRVFTPRSFVAPFRALSEQKHDMRYVLF